MKLFEVCQYCGKLPVDTEAKVRDDDGLLYCSQEHLDARHALEEAFTE